MGNQRSAPWSSKPSPCAEEVNVPAGHIPSLEHFLLDQKQATWALSLNFLTHKMEGILPPGTG